MKRRWKIILGVLVTLLVLVEAADYFLAESTAIAWHLQHGFHAEMRGLRFRVPFLYYEDHGINMLELSFDTIPGHLNKKDASITVDFHKQPPDPPESTELRETRLKKFGMKQSGVHQLRLAGREGTCTDFVATSAASVLGPYMTDCSFGEDLHVHFHGTENAIADFYAIIQSAESVKGTH